MTGGKVTASKYGKEYMAEIGRRGYEKARAKLAEQGRNFHQEGGNASWASQNGRAILNGEFPNQSLQQWGYTTKVKRGKTQVVKENFDSHFEAINRQ